MTEIRGSCDLLPRCRRTIEVGSLRFGTHGPIDDARVDYNKALAKIEVIEGSKDSILERSVLADQMQIQIGAFKLRKLAHYATGREVTVANVELRFADG